jgi:plasmid maintenance system antidote protein VapI
MSMSAQTDGSTSRDQLDRIRAIIEVVGVATLTVTQLVSAATAITAATRRRRSSCR